MKEPCQVEGCTNIARWHDAVRAEWSEIIPPGDFLLRENWERETRDIKIYWENHCDHHHHIHVNQHGEHSMSVCVDDHLKRVLEETAQTVHRRPRVWYPCDPCEDENENARTSE